MACMCCCSTSPKGWLLPWSCQHWILTSSAGLKYCFSLYDYGDQGAQSTAIFPVCFQCVLYPCCSKSFHICCTKQLSVSKLSVTGIFESVETQWHFITVAHLLVRNVFLVSIILSQSLWCSVITGQCSAVLSVNQNLGTLKLHSAAGCRYHCNLQSLGMFI